MTLCEYFTRYGDSGNPGMCREPATLALMSSHLASERPICVCTTHADTITRRFPSLGTVEQRFATFEQLASRDIVKE